MSTDLEFTVNTYNRLRSGDGDKRVKALCRYLGLQIHDAFEKATGDAHE